MSKTAVPDERIELLPGAIRPVAELAGFEAVERLIEVYGGTRLYIPSTVVSQAIVQSCGKPVAEALHQCFGGDYVVLPLAKRLATARKHAAIRADKRDAGEIARDYKMSVNSVHRIRGLAGEPVKVAPKGARRPTVDARQADLLEWLVATAPKKRRA